jgi:hypothetical protein
MLTLYATSDKLGLMFRQVCIDQRKEQTSIEELSNEDTIGNGGKTFTVSVLTYPSNGTNNDLLKNGVESNDDSRDGQRSLLVPLLG